MWNFLRDLLNDLQAIRDLLMDRTENFREKRSVYHFAEPQTQKPPTESLPYPKLPKGVGALTNQPGETVAKRQSPEAAEL